MFAVSAKCTALQESGEKMGDQLDLTSAGTAIDVVINSVPLLISPTEYSPASHTKTREPCEDSEKVIKENPKFWTSQPVSVFMINEDGSSEVLGCRLMAANLPSPETQSINSTPSIWWQKGIPVISRIKLGSICKRTTSSSSGMSSGWMS